MHIGFSFLYLFDFMIGWVACKVRVLFFVYPSFFFLGP